MNSEGIGGRIHIPKDVVLCFAAIILIIKYFTGHIELALDRTNLPNPVSFEENMYNKIAPAVFWICSLK